MEVQEMETDQYYDFQGSDDCSDDLPMNKKRKLLSEDERLKRCRERNRIHARNTRERKKLQLDVLQSRIKELMTEKMMLKNTAVDTSVATILMSLAGGQCHIEEEDPMTEMESALNKTASEYANMTIEKLRLHISLETEEDEFQMDQSLILKDKASCTVAELESIRRERNRMHAKKTRMRKKKMLEEMETIVYALEDEIQQIKSASGGYGRSKSASETMSESSQPGKAFRNPENTEASFVKEANLSTGLDEAETKEHAELELQQPRLAISQESVTLTQSNENRAQLAVEQDDGDSQDFKMSHVTDSQLPLHAFYSNDLQYNSETTAMQSCGSEVGDSFLDAHHFWKVIKKDSGGYQTPKTVVHRICASDSSGNDDDDERIQEIPSSVPLVGDNEECKAGQSLSHISHGFQPEPDSSSVKPNFALDGSQSNVANQSVA